MSEKRLEFFLDNPELSIRHSKAIPTEEMYRFFPPKNEIISIEGSDEKDIYRYIFNGQPKTNYEQKKLDKFFEYEASTGKINYPNFWLESDTMRLLQASEFDIKKTYSAIKENIEWLNTIPKAINDKIIYLLNSGFLYIHGRDFHFRPIIIVSIKMLKVVLSQNYTFDDINKCTTYLVNYLIKYLLIPGQIENWVNFVDFEDVGISDIGNFKKILSTLSKFRGRVFKNFFVNISGILKISVKAAVKVFSSVAKKLVILGSNEFQKVQEIISPENMEKKYGGLAPNVIPGGNNLFPPVVPSSTYTAGGERINIVSPDTYKEMCLNSNPFKPFVVCPKYEEIWREESEERRLKEEFNKKSITVQSNEKGLELTKDSNKNILPPTIKPKSYENKRQSNHGINKNIIRKNNKLEINEFLKEFEGLNNLENIEERNYCVPSPINMNEINFFFKRIKDNQKFFKCENF